MLLDQLILYNITIITCCHRLICLRSALIVATVFTDSAIFVATLPVLNVTKNETTEEEKPAKARSLTKCFERNLNRNVLKSKKS